MNRREFNEAALSLATYVQAINHLDLDQMAAHLEAEEADGGVTEERQYDLNMTARLISAAEHLIDTAAMGGR